MRLKRNSSSSFHSLLYQNSRWHRDAHRDARMRAWFTHPFANVKKNLAATLVGSMTQSSTSSCGRPNRWTMPGVAIVTNNASIPEQGCAGHSPNSANRKHQITRHSWRTSPPLRPSLSFRYTRARTHLSLEKDAPVSRAVERAGQILCRPILGGLHHEYVRI